MGKEDLFKRLDSEALKKRVLAEELSKIENLLEKARKETKEAKVFFEELSDISAVHEFEIEKKEKLLALLQQHMEYLRGQENTREIVYLKDKLSKSIKELQALINKLSNHIDFKKYIENKNNPK